MEWIRIAAVCSEVCEHGKQRPVSKVLQAVELSDKDLCKSVHALDWDPRYDTGWIVQASNLGHDLLGLYDVIYRVKLLFAIDGSGGARTHGLLFIEVQIMVWAADPRGRWGSKTQPSSGFGALATRMRLVSTVEMKMLIYVWTPMGSTVALK